jgi:cell division protein FtsL
MKAKLLLIIIAFSVSNIFAQTDSLRIEKRITILEKQIVNQQEQLNNFYKELAKDYWTYRGVKNQVEEKYSNQDRTIDSLQKIIDSNAKRIQDAANELGVKIEDTHQYANQSITDLNKTVSQNTLYWIIAILVVALFVLIVFIFLRKQIFKQKTDLDSNLQDTRKALEEEGVKLDNKLIEVLEAQLKIINNANAGAEQEADHTLALKVADEIVRIEKNISKMDNETKGIKPLVKGIERIKDNFKANGYDMVQLLDKEYDDGMNIDVINFIDDDTIPSGKKIITRIIKPQVNYKDVLIQRAQVDVSQN